VLRKSVQHKPRTKAIGGDALFSFASRANQRT
jgi:hypothetical protein